MMTTNENAYAKLNISLDVTERREDGYHDMLMVMQTVSLCDEVTVTLDESGRVRARSNLRFIPGDERNLAVKAALYFLEETGHAGQGMLIEINKRIPVGAGMGGGHDEREQTLNAMLVEMDGLESRTGVIVLAATNRPDVLDPALLRPGRFDRQVVMDLPDIVGRRQILDVHVKKIKTDASVDLDVMARTTPGFSGADLANLC